MRAYFKLLFLIPALALVRCTQQVDPSADIPTVSYSQEISPIISSNCALSGCHDGNSHEFALLSYSDLMHYVTPADAHGSQLYEVIRLYSGERAMPPSPNTPLTDQQIASIYVWILQGALDN